MKHPFEKFLDTFIPTLSAKQKQLNKALWLLETTGSEDAADLKAELDAEVRLLYNQLNIYLEMQEWEKDPLLIDPLLKRQLNVLLREFRQQVIPPQLSKEMAIQEAHLLQSYANFRPTLEGKILSDNDLREILKKENDPAKRKKAWEASKEIGEVLAPQILKIVELRNQAAKSVGYNNYFQMKLVAQEVDENWLFNTLDRLAVLSDEAYQKEIHYIEKEQEKRFGVKEKELGPWAWSDLFGQEDPLATLALDGLTKDIDICNGSVKFYQLIGFDILPILKKSDMFERSGKNQHAFCLNMDREKDVRTLNNVKPTIKWLETVLHEFGHAVYELGFDPELPWLLREPPHMLTTEAMALLAGRYAYYPASLHHLIKNKKQVDDLGEVAQESLKRRQLIFSRWVLVMTYFERELYRNPKQDLNKLWWDLVQKYQKINPPKDRNTKKDWATKYHIALAPVYYYSYLLGEMFASQIEETLAHEIGSKEFSPKMGKLLIQKLFKPGNSLPWYDLVEQVTKKPLQANAWIGQFGG